MKSKTIAERTTYVVAGLETMPDGSVRECEFRSLTLSEALADAVLLWHPE